MLAVTTGRKWWLLPLLAGPCNVAGASQGSQPVDIGPSLSYTQGLVCPSGPAPGIQDLDFPSTEPGTVSCRLSTKKISLCVHLRLLYPIQHCDAERSVKICLMSSGSPMLSPLALSHHFLKLDWNSLLRNLIRPTQSRSYQLCPRLHVLTSFYKLPWFFNLKNYHDEDTNCKTESIYNIVLCENNGILLTFLCKENVLVHAFKNSKHQYSKRCLFACCWFLAAVREDKKTSAWRAFVPILWSICVLMIHCDKWKVRHLFQASGHCLDLYFDISIVLYFQLYILTRFWQEIAVWIDLCMWSYWLLLHFVMKLEFEKTMFQTPLKSSFYPNKKYLNCKSLQTYIYKNQQFCVLCQWIIVFFSSSTKSKSYSQFIGYTNSTYGQGLWHCALAVY